MTAAEAINQAFSQAGVEKVETRVLVINGENTAKTMKIKQNCATEAHNTQNKTLPGISTFQVECKRQIQGTDEFRNGGINIFSETKNKINYTDRPKIWPGREKLQLIWTLTLTEQEVCGTAKGLYNKVSVKFKPKHDVTILLLQHCKLVRYTDGSV